MSNSAILEIQRLETNNMLIASQAIEKVKRLISEKLEHEKFINEKTTNMPEIDFLWEKCTDTSPLVADGACKVFITLVVNRQADYLFVVNGFVNQALSKSSNVSNVIIGLKDMLTLPILIEDKLIGQMFNLRCPLHPFVRILKAQPDLWPIILEQTKLMLSCCKTSDNANFCSLVIPILQYILWDPARSISFTCMRHLLIRAVVNFCSYFPNLYINQQLHQCIFWMQVNTVGDIFESSFHLKEMVSVYLHLPVKDECMSRDCILLCLLATCLKLTLAHSDVTEFLEIIEQLVLGTTQFQATEETQTSIVILALLLTHSVPMHQSSIIKICTHLISRKGMDPLINGTLFMPLILIMNVTSYNVPHPLKASHVSNGLQVAAFSLMNFLEQRLHSEDKIRIQKAKYVPPSQVVNDNVYQAKNFCVETLTAMHVVRLIKRVKDTPGSLGCWLRYANKILQSNAYVSDTLLCMGSSFLIHGFQDINVITQIVNFLVKCGQKDHEKAPSLIPIFLYKLRTSKNPIVRMHILKSIPLLGIHKSCISQILQTLLTISKSIELKAFAIYLMGLLWQNQERVFPHFHKLIVETNEDLSAKAVASVDEVSLAKAAAILEVCKLKPHLYGGELLTVLSTIISDSISESGTPLSVLALESLICLCKAEVIDLRTTWRFLAPNLKMDNRALVKQKLCEFLSLAETLRVDTVEYEKFISDCVYLLWRFATANEKSSISGAAYRALANFDSSRHAIKFLPQEIKNQIKLPAKLAATPFEANQRPEDVLKYVPGSAYVNLMTSVSLAALNGYGEFLCALVRQEVRDMPRSILHFSRTSAVSLKQKQINEIISCLPRFIYEQHECRQQPTLVGSLALGLLLSYNPEELGRDGKPTRHSVIQQGKAYDSMLEALLMQSSLEISDWRKIVIMPTAWSAFMERAYFSIIEARVVSLELQQQDKGSGSTGDFKELRNKAWLWARDKISDSLKRISRGKPSFHGNAVLALTGLMAAVTKYNNLYNENKSSEEILEGTEHLPHNYWLTEGFKAVLNILNHTSELERSPFFWSQPCPGSSSSIIQTHAALAIVSLAPILISWDTEWVSEILRTLHQHLQNAPVTYPVLQFCIGLSFGHIISSLVVEHYFDVGGDEGKKILLSNAKILKRWCLEGDLDTKCGGILGLSMISSSFCQEGCQECYEFVLSTINAYEQRLQEETAISLAYDVLLIGQVLITVTAAGYGLLKHDAAESLFTELQQQTASSPNSSGKATAYGLLLQYLASTGSKLFVEARENQLRCWIKNIKSKSVPTLAKLAAVNGAFSLFSICLESTFFWGFDVSVAEAIKSPLLADFLTVLCHALSSTDDSGVQNCGAWMLGSTYFNLTQKLNSSNESCDYSFLGDQSILKPVVNFIITSIKTGRHVDDKQYVSICFKCLSQVVERPYPALHWPSLLKPYLRVSNDIQELLFDVVIARAPNSFSACTLLSSWMISSSLVLMDSCKMKLFNALHTLIHILSVKTVQSFLNKNILELFNQQPLPVDVLVVFIKGLLKALKSLKATTEVLQMLHLTVVDVFHHIDPNCLMVWNVFCEIAAELPDEILDQMATSDMNKPVAVVKVIKLRCHLVGNGTQPLIWLNECVDVAVLASLNAVDRNTLNQSFLTCFENHSQILDDEDSRTTARVSWLLEIMGHIRNVMEWRSNLPILDTNQMKKVILNLFHIYTLAVAGWCGAGIGLQFFCWMPTNDSLAELVVDLLPSALAQLVSIKPWNVHGKQIFEWLLLVCKNSSTPDVVQNCIKTCFLILRNSDDFKKTSLWTRVVELEGLQ